MELWFRILNNRKPISSTSFLELHYKFYPSNLPLWNSLNQAKNTYLVVFHWSVSSVVLFFLIPFLHCCNWIFFFFHWKYNLRGKWLSVEQQTNARLVIRLFMLLIYYQLMVFLIIRLASNAAIAMVCWWYISSLNPYFFFAFMN